MWMAKSLHVIIRWSFSETMKLSQRISQTTNKYLNFTMAMVLIRTIHAIHTLGASMSYDCETLARNNNSTFFYFLFLLLLLLWLKHRFHIRLNKVSDNNIFLTSTSDGRSYQRKIRPWKMARGWYPGQYRRVFWFAIWFGMGHAPKRPNIGWIDPRWPVPASVIRRLATDRRGENGNGNEIRTPPEFYGPVFVATNSLVRSKRSKTSIAIGGKSILIWNNSIS